MTTTITGATGIDNIKAATGATLQVVSATQGGVSLVATSSTTYVATGLTKTITPSSTSSKIRIDASFYADADTTGATLFFIVKRGSTSLGGGSQDANTGINLVSNTRLITSLFFTYLDSPSTTSATTYELYMKTANSSNTVRYRPDDVLSSLILTEIAG